MFGEEYKEAVAEEVRICTYAPDGSAVLLPKSELIAEVVTDVQDGMVIDGAPEPAAAYAQAKLTIDSADLCRRDENESAIFGIKFITFFNSRWQADPTDSGAHIIGFDTHFGPESACGEVFQKGGSPDGMTDGDTITLGSKTYTWQDVLTNVDGNVLIGADYTESLQNLYDAMNLTGTPGTQYAAAMTANADFYASAVDSTHIHFEAKYVGTFGSALPASCSIDSGNFAFGAATLGTDPSGIEFSAALASVFPYLATKSSPSAPLRAFTTANTPISVDYLLFDAVRPGTSSNDIQTTSTNPSLLSWDDAGSVGGLNSPTTGTVGQMRAGPVDVNPMSTPNIVERTFVCTEPDMWFDMYNGQYDGWATLS